MGRSVSYPNNCSAVCFKDISHFGMVDNDNLGEPIFDDFLSQLELDDLKADIREQATANWPSLFICDEWLDNEDLALLENNLCYIGISTYCGLAAIWLVAKENDYNYSDTENISGLANRWCNQISSGFSKLFCEYKKVGTLSNGEAVFEKNKLISYCN